MKLVSYARISSAGERSGSLETQKVKVASWAPIVGHEVVAHYADEDVSGAVPPLRRSGFRQAVSVVEHGDAAGIVVVNIDRISRSTSDFLSLVEQFRKRGWHLISISQAIDTTTAAGRLFLTMSAAYAQFEREITGERQRASMQRRKQDGLAYCHKAPYGFKKSADGRLVAVPAEQEVEEFCLRLRKAGKLYAEIADRCAERFTVEPRRNVPFSDRVCNDIVRNAMKRGAVEKEVVSLLHIPRRRQQHRKLPSLLEGGFFDQGVFGT